MTDLGKLKVMEYSFDTESILYFEPSVITLILYFGSNGLRVKLLKGQ